MKPRSGRQLDERRALVVYEVQQESWGVPYLFAEVWVSPEKSLVVTTYGGLHGTLNTHIDTRPPTGWAGLPWVPGRPQEGLASSGGRRRYEVLAMSDAEFHRLTSGPHVEVAPEGQAGLTVRGVSA
jgi:hypothetical protein